MSLSHLVAALDANFAGYEREQRLMRLAPKFGNDDAYADEMLCRVSEHVARSYYENKHSASAWIIS